MKLLDWLTGKRQTPKEQPNEENVDAIVESLSREDSLEMVIRHFDGEEMPREEWPDQEDQAA